MIINYSIMKKIRNNYFRIPEGCEVDINKSTLKKPVFIKKSQNYENQ